MKIPKYIEIRVEGQDRAVLSADYVAVKLKQLREFGYESLTADGVREELRRCIAGERLSVIGSFMTDEVITRKGD